MPTTISSQESHLVIEDGAIYYPDKERDLGVTGLDLEQVTNLGHLVVGHFAGVPIRTDKIRESGVNLDESIGNLPVDLRKKWGSEPMTNLPMIASHGHIVNTIQAARMKQYPGKLFVEPGAENHFAAHDYGTQEDADTFFEYLTNQGLHIRRIGMLADLAIQGIREAQNKKGSAVLVDFGTGPFPLETLVNLGLSDKERAATEIVAVDTSEDLIRYGLEEKLIDRGHVLDISKKTAEEYQDILPVADVVVFAEILEHIPHDAVVFRDTVLPWMRGTNARLIGSVPNTVQLAEYRSLLLGTGSPHQLERPIFYPEQDHFSFHTVYTLAKMLRHTWGFRGAGIVSNGVRLQKHGNTAHLYAGLDCPSVGDRLVFWAENPS